MVKMCIIGRLTRDPETRYYGKENDEVTNFTLADNYVKDKSMYVDCSAFGKNSEIAGEFLSKGDIVYVEGNVKPTSFTLRNGTQVKGVELTVTKIQLLPNYHKDGGEIPLDENTEEKPKRKPKTRSNK